MIRLPMLAVLAVLLAGAALAHNGVKNAAVMARMDAMSAIGAEMKTLGQMAKGAAPFDGDKAKAAFATIARHAARTPGLFKAREDDPKSEARPEIWERFEDFTAKSEALERTALDLSTSLTSSAELAGAVKSLGQACQACHKAYRE